jgi:prepilin-type N-terminal cleavage/methylation domain-containing protein
MRRLGIQTPFGARRRSQAGLTLIELLVTMIIMAIVSTMLVGGWISLQRSYAFARSKNMYRAYARDALDRMSSELRASQPPTALSTTQFYVTGSSPYICGPMSCVFYSAYNNGAAPDGTGLAQSRLTMIWLDTSTKKLWWRRYTAADAVPGVSTAYKETLLARNVVNNSIANTKVTPNTSYTAIFTYYFRDAGGNWRDSLHSDFTSLASTGTYAVANLRSIQIELIVDANISHTPTYVDIRTTIRPRNASAIF